MRLTKNQLNALERKYNVDRIWSFSRLNTWHSCPTEYQKKYVEKMKLDGSSVYTEFGTFSHNLIQSCINGEIKYDEMFIKWCDIVGDWEVDPNSYQFDSDKIKTGYISNLNHYFSHTQIPKGSHFETEKPVLARVGKNGKYIFVGYIDNQYIDEDGNTVLVDYKTSSRSSFSKAKLPEKSLQLMLYAIGKHQYNHIPYSKIRCMFDMMKYVRVHYKQENGNWNTTIQERSEWVSKIKKKLITKLKKHGVKEDNIEPMAEVAALKNNLRDLPEEIQEQFYLENYVIELEVNEKECEKVAKRLEEECNKITEFESLSQEDQDSYLEINHPYDPNNYYDKKLCSYHTSQEFRDKEKALNDILEPEIIDDNNIDDLFSDNVMSEVFS